MGIPISQNNLAKAIARRRWVRRLDLFKLPATAWVELSGQKFYVDLSDWKGPSYHVLNWGLESYETANIGFIREYFQQNPSGTLFDIGANVGIFSFLLSRQFPQMKIFAFEPNPVAFHCLQQTFSGARWVHLNHLALSDKKGEALLFEDKMNHGGHSLNRQAILDDGNEVGRSVAVPTDTLDDFAQGLAALDFIKLDVQRHEAQVLRGAHQTIAKHRPIVLMECYFEELLAEKAPLLEPFREQNYVLIEPVSRARFDLSAGDLLKLKATFRDYVDLAFVPFEKAALFKGH